MQDMDEDPYASVDDEQKKSELIRFKVKTLDIAEGSGDSSFYAKVHFLLTHFPTVRKFISAKHSLHQWFFTFCGLSPSRCS